ncbi:hypothetical protein GCM10009525_45650 [Streptosporangium amethystogenes subsp. fukuiense]
MIMGGSEFLYWFKAAALRAAARRDTPRRPGTASGPGVRLWRPVPARASRDGTA